MKQYIFILLLTVPAISASSSTAITDAGINPPLPSIVINNMVRQSLTDILQTRPEGLASSIGSAFLTMHAVGGVDTLCYVPPILKQAQHYVATIVSDDYLIDLCIAAKKLKEEDRPEFERVIAWTRFDTAYRMLQKKLVETDIPGFTLLTAPRETIECNKEIVLDENGLIYFSAAQLSMGLAMQEQFNIDPIAFYLAFKTWIPTELKMQSGLSLWSWLYGKRT